VVLLQVLVDVGLGEGGVSSEVELSVRAFVSVNDGFSQVPPSIG
jgi:hypothetical protein